MGLKIAVASADGIFSDLHFGQAEEFHIYGIDGGGISLLEKRRVENMPAHSAAELDRIYERLSDCGAIVASRIGLPVAAYFIKRGIRIFESEFAIIDILNKFVAENTFGSQEK